MPSSWFGRRQAARNPLGAPGDSITPTRRELGACNRMKASRAVPINHWFDGSG
jgi:hypothetical protein